MEIDPQSKIILDRSEAAALGIVLSKHRETLDFDYDDRDTLYERIRLRRDFIAEQAPSADFHGPQAMEQRMELQKVGNLLGFMLHELAPHIETHAEETVSDIEDFLRDK